MKNARFLKKGITTGTCAAAAAKAAAIFLLTGERVKTVAVTLPAGKSVTVDVAKTEMRDGAAVCSVVKYSGDDPDITDGITVRAAVTKTDGGIMIDGGEGVGRVTKSGLDREVGEAAINSVPRGMIRGSVTEAAANYEGGFNVIISVPGGEEIAKKTFNPRLGIEGGISILGTSGIVEPMSEKALTDTIYLELKTTRAEGHKTAVLVPGNYGADFALREFGIEKTVQCSNFVGDALDYASDLGFTGAVLISHMGKLVKLGSGIMNTHSSYADGRMETLALCAALAGVKDFEKILACPTTDAAYEIIRDTKTISVLMERIDMYLSRRVNIKTGAVMFLNKYGVIGKTKHADALLKEI